jgi:hypothetical protein
MSAFRVCRTLNCGAESCRADYPKFGTYEGGFVRFGFKTEPFSNGPGRLIVQVEVGHDWL